LQEDRLTSQLRSSAAQFAQSGLRARLDREWAVHQLHIATALELLAKAKLASLHGSLIAAKDFDSLLHLSGHPRHAKPPPDRVRTITITDALARVGQVVPPIENLRSELKYLADVRNGVVHAGHLNSEAQDRVLLPFITACDLLLGDMEASRDDFWGEYVDVVDTHRAESIKAAEVEAAEAITLARMAFAERFAELDEPTRKAILTSIVEGYAPEKYEQDLYDCPACGTPALVHGSHDVDWEPEWELDEEGQPWSPGASFVVTFRPGTLECRACGLVLDGQDQLTAAEVPESWEVQDADPRDFYEPDEDR
jgi:hypothetical protein